MIRFTKRVRRGLYILANRAPVVDYLNHNIAEEDALAWATREEIEDASLAQYWILQELVKRGEL